MLRTRRSRRRHNQYANLLIEQGHSSGNQILYLGFVGRP
jgi:hypothetical protein